MNLNNKQLERTIRLPVGYNSAWRISPSQESAVAVLGERVVSPSKMTGSSVGLPSIHHNSGVSNATFDRTGARLRSYAGDLGFRWRLAEEKLPVYVQPFSKPPDPPPSFGFTPYYLDWNYPDQTEKHKLSGIYRLNRYIWDKNGQRQEYLVWSLTKPGPMECPTGIQTEFRAASNDGRYVLFAAKEWKPGRSDAGGLRAWDAAERKWIGPIIADVPTGSGPFQGSKATLSGDGAAILVLKGDSICAFDSRSGKTVGSWRLGTTANRQFDEMRLRYFDLDRETLRTGPFVVVAFNNLDPEVIDLRKPGAIHINKSADAAGFSTGQLLATSADGARFAAFGPMGQNAVNVYHLSSASPVGPPLAHPDSVSDVDLSEDGRTVATVAHSTVRIWNADTGALAAPTIDVPGTVDCLTLSQSKKMIGVTSGPKTYQADAIRIYDTGSGRLLFGPVTVPGCRSIRFSKNDKSIYALSFSGYARIDLAGVRGSLKELEDVAALLNGGRLGPRGDLAYLTTKEVSDLWQRVGRTYLANYATKAESDDDYHARRFNEAREQEEMRTAFWHAGQLPKERMERLWGGSDSLSLLAVQKLPTAEFKSFLDKLFPGQNGDGTRGACYLALMVGDKNRYQRECVALLSKASTIEKPADILAAIAACRYLPASAPEYGAIERQLDRIGKLDPNVLNSALTPGFVLYRKGRYQEAFDRIQAAFKTQKIDGNSHGRYLQAMALHRLGKREEARRLFEQAVNGQSQVERSWMDSVELRWLRSEASNVLQYDVEQGTEQTEPYGGS